MINVVRNKFKALRSQKRYPRLIRAAAFVYRHARQLKTLACLPLAISRLRKTVCQKGDTSTALIEPSLDAAFDNLYGAIRPLQNRSEIYNLLQLLASRKPKRILEIGTANGGTLFLFCRIADPNATIISVDLPGGWFGGGYPRWKGILYRRFASAGQKLHLIRADSHRPETLEQVERILAGDKLDFVFIDGDHTYEGVSQDFQKYRQLCATDAVIGFHDIVTNAADPDCEVPRFWNDLRAHCNTTEFVENPAQLGAGIGLVFLREMSMPARESDA
jgi:predicted O-methyltransferase YrrM